MMAMVAIVAISISLASTRDEKLSEVAYLAVVGFFNSSTNTRQTGLKKDIIIIIIIITCNCMLFWCMTPCRFFSDVSVNVTHRRDVTAHAEV
jgi:hypothetical protein